MIRICLIIMWASLGGLLLSASGLFLLMRWNYRQWSRRPRYRVVIHLQNKALAWNDDFCFKPTPEPLVWYANEPWPMIQRHLPPCGSDFGDTIVDFYEIGPPLT